MIGRIVEVAENRRYLCLYRGFMMVHETGGDRAEIGRVPLDDITAVIANAHGLSYSNNLLVALAERGAPLVLCGANHNPVGMLITVDGNYEQSRRMAAQCLASQPVKKRLWAAVVKAKLACQAATLEAVGLPTAPLSALVKKVRSGDPNNIEAQGARRYWTLLFGEAFRRNRDAEGINSLLNYGYTVFRAACARAVIAAGLHPSLGVYHSNAANPMRLVDDLIEPFRPVVDLNVWRLANNGELAITPSTKRILVRALYDDMQTDAGLTPVTVCMQKLAVSLAQVYLGEKKELELPIAGLPVVLQAALRGE